MIAYEVSVLHPATHTLHVSVTLDVPEDEVTFSIPAWTPGSYLVREFSRYLGEPRCSVDDTPRQPLKTAKGTWSVDTSDARTLRIDYDVRGHELTVRTPHIDDSHAYFLGSNALVFIHGRMHEDARVAVRAPESWNTFCPLEQREGAFHAPNYDVLADAPFEIGPHRVEQLDIAGVPHRLIFWGDNDVDVQFERLAADIRAIVEQNLRVFGGPLPYSNYDFVFHITDTARGGLEHLNSTVLATPWSMFESDEGYGDLLGLISHEHFHTWNVKRIRPAELGPFDYLRENYTTGLWVAEGLTSYYDAFNAVRAGVLTRDKWLGDLARDLGRYRSTPGRFRQSLAQSSRDAWIRLYRPDEDTPNRTVSYYLKGSLVALSLDLLIRNRTDGKRSLDNVMRALWADFLESGAGFDDDRVIPRIAEAAGADVESALRAWVHEPVDPPIEDLLATHGVSVTPEPNGSATLGLEFTDADGALRVKTVFADGPAHGAGVSPGDLVFAIDGRHAIEAHRASIERRLVEGSPVDLHGIRRGRHFSCTLVPSPAPATKLSIALNPDAGTVERARWEAWTGLAFPPTDSN